LINTLLGKVFGTKNEREVKRLMPRVAAINALEPEMQKLSDEQLRAKTDGISCPDSGASQRRQYS
jgi:preprotein translocase subunit SecA